MKLSPSLQNFILFFGLSLVTYVEMDDHSGNHDWRYYALLVAFALSALALLFSLLKLVRR